MKVAEFLEKFGRAVFESPLSAATTGEVPEELAEIRLAVLDRVKEKSYRAGGKKVFPFDRIRVEIRGVDESRRDLFAGVFFRRYLEHEVCNALHGAGCRFPEKLRVDIEPLTGFPQSGEPWLIVEALSQQSAAAGARTGVLEVSAGDANVQRLRLEKPRINIGRVVDVYRDGGLHRRNDLAFAAETEINASVSREHAHITFDRVSGEYRVFNDRWYARDGKASTECGIWIVRDGMSQEVHRTSRGAKLEPGDEIHFGRAVVVFGLE
ncbi:MAG TPA: FHA domain-containing protein [Candidatus Limnocylindrales bacterium]|nr:FHA domain-containing protein [Candidatus Limnocylindrales bacterium]